MRMRFTLLNALLAMALIAAAITVFLQQADIDTLRRENKILNEERGTLMPPDRRSVSAIRVPERFAKNNGTFRVFIPEGASYAVVAQANNIPMTGIPIVDVNKHSNQILGSLGKNGASGVLEPGEHQISLSVEKRNHGQFVCLRANHLPLDIAAVEPDHGDVQFFYGSDAVHNETKHVNPGDQLVLLRNRRRTIRANRNFPHTDYPGPLDGMMLWLEPLNK